MCIIPDSSRGKLDPKFKLGLFIGYDSRRTGYRVMDPRTRTVIVTRDVKFIEDQFTVAQSLTVKPSMSINPPTVGIDDRSQRR